jgi:hypothetical protein
VKRITEADVPPLFHPPGARLLTGYASWPFMTGKASAWILHTLFRNDAMPDLTWEEMSKKNDPDLRALAETGIQSKSTQLGSEWRRIRWRDHAIAPDYQLPSSTYSTPGRTIAYSSPPEGFMDRLQFERLVPVLADFSLGGREAACTVVFPELAMPHDSSEPAASYGGQIDTTIDGLVDAYGALEIGPCNRLGQ